MGKLNIMRKQALGPGTIHEWHVWPSLLDGTVLPEDRLHIYRYLDGEVEQYPDVVIRCCDGEPTYPGCLMPDADEYSGVPKCPQCAVWLTAIKESTP